jgi:phosphotriesterase-related protein
VGIPPTAIAETLGQHGIGIAKGPSDRERAKALAKLCRSGYSERLLLSQDVGHKHYLREYGGWGYGHVLQDFTHHMAEAGIDRDAISKFFIQNPARVLSIGV